MPADKSLAVRIRKARSLATDLAASYAVEIVSMIGGLALMAMVARRYGPDDFATYQVARGIMSATIPLLGMGLAIGAMRYLPRAGKGAQRLAHRLLVLQFAVISTFGLTAAMSAEAWRGQLGLTLGEARSVILVLAGTSLLSQTIASQRGTQRVGAALSTTLIGVTGAPLLAILITDSISDFLLIQAIFTLCICMVAVFSSLRPTRTECTIAEVHPRRVIHYGLRRLPGDIALPFILAFPTLYASTQADDPATAGYLGFTTSAIILVCSVFSLLNQILIPRYSRSFATQGDHIQLDRRHLRLPAASFALAMLGATFILIFASELVTIYLGDGFHPAVRVLKLGVLAAGPMAIFYSTRPILDALQDRPSTVHWLLIASGVQVLVTLVSDEYLDTAAASLGGLWVGLVILAVGCTASLIRLINGGRLL